MNQPGEEWLPLLLRLTSASDSWGVWKNADRALEGEGDVDSSAPPVEHALLAREFRRWASESGLQWMVECRHAGAMLGLFGLSETRWAQLDIVDRWPFRGALLFSAQDLVPMMTMDARGFRRLRSGAEGFFLFLTKGFDITGRPAPEFLRRYRILDKMSEDWAGTEVAADLLGAGAHPFLRAARAALDGGWDRRALMATQARMVARGLRDPRMLVSRATTRAWSLPRCAVNREVLAGRRPQDLRTWIIEVERRHPVQRL